MAHKITTDFEKNCLKAIEHFKLEVGRLRGGRASTTMLESIQVNYYGSMVPMIQVGMLASPEPRLLTIQVYDGNAVEAVEKAIQQAELGLNPSREGNLVRIMVPALSEERRKELIKTLHRMAEEAKVSVRNCRRDALDIVKKDKEKNLLSEDEVKRLQEEVQKITDKHVKLVDENLAQKEKDMLAV
jgi:ribosome recycling factor